ncbi:transcriptional regulator [Nocardia sp. NPDC004278]
MPIGELKVAKTPRLRGENSQHARLLADVDGVLPPIIVSRATMEVIDGAHRLRAARLRGESEIEVSFFTGTEADAFVLAVHANTTHGLPLSREERLAAASRITRTHPDWSDRAIAEYTGLSTKTVAATRDCSTAVENRLNKRVGRDGKARAVDSSRAREQAAALLGARPDASLREIARAVGLSPATVSDVKARLSRGEGPAVRRGELQRADSTTALDLSGAGAILASLRRDPSIRSSEKGRALLRLLDTGVDRRTREQLISVIPAHRIPAVAQVAQMCAKNWQEFAAQLASLPQHSI